MKCPVCDVDLLMTEKKGIEVDYCPKCRGVWLDRGELEKVIELSIPESGRRPADNSYYEDDHHNKHEDKHRGGHYDEKYGKRKRGSFLGDIFDF